MAATSFLRPAALLRTGTLDGEHGDDSARQASSATAEPPAPPGAAEQASPWRYISKARRRSPSPQQGQGAWPRHVDDALLPRPGQGEQSAAVHLDDVRLRDLHTPLHSRPTCTGTGPRL